MQCPFCRSKEKTIVVDSRRNGDRTRRRRKCEECKARFTTYESMECRYPRIVKSNNRREEYQQDKLGRSIDLALRKRPIITAERNKLITSIEHSLFQYKKEEVDAKWLGKQVMQALLALDQVAYVRYASVYQAFNDVEAFLEEISDLKSMPSAKTKQAQIDLFSGGREGSA